MVKQEQVIGQKAFDAIIQDAHTAEIQLSQAHKTILQGVVIAATHPLILKGSTNYDMELFLKNCSIEVSLYLENFAEVNLMDCVTSKSGKRPTISSRDCEGVGILGSSKKPKFELCLENFQVQDTTLALKHVNLSSSGSVIVERSNVYVSDAKIEAQDRLILKLGQDKTLSLTEHSCMDSRFTQVEVDFSNLLLKDDSTIQGNQLFYSSNRLMPKVEVTAREITVGSYPAPYQK